MGPPPCAPHIPPGVSLISLPGNRPDRSELHVRLFAAAATLDPHDASIPYDMGNHLAKLGRRDEAIAAYGQALQIDGGLAWAWYNRGRLLYDSGRFDEGLEA